MKGPMRASALAVIVAGGPGCLIELTPGFGGDTSGSEASTGSSGEPDPTTSSASSDGDDDVTDGGDTSTGGGVPEPPSLAPRGYESRPCGFDLDHDGVLGEPEDCVVCDGITPDPDGDGYAQPIFYVDCDAGTDPAAGADAACRDPDAPCATLARALEEVPFAPGEFDEQGVVCFSGTCRESVPIRSGRPMIATRPAAGNEVRDFDYPAQPSMLVGWDRDGDHEYPPHDRDDRAEIVPGPEADGALRIGYGSYNTPTHDIEYAHFVVRTDVAAGETAPPTGLLSSPIGVDAAHERIHLHDLSLRSLRQGRSASAEAPIVHLDLRGYGATEAEVSSTQFAWLAIENVEFVDYGGYLFAEHADMAEDPTGPIRLKNITARALSCDKSLCDRSASASIWRVGGWVQEVEILSSVFDANTDEWYPFEGGDPLDDPGPTAIFVGECAQDIAIVDNDFLGWATALRVEANGATNVAGEDSRPCDARDVDLVRFEGNVVADVSDRLAASSVGVILQTARPDAAIGDDRTIANVTIVNDVFIAEHGRLGCAWAQVWGAGAGSILFAHDTCLGAITDVVPYPEAALVRVLDPRPGALDPAGAIGLVGNLFGGQVGQAGQAGQAGRAVATDYAPTGWTSDHNVFAPGSEFLWAGGRAVDLAQWSVASGGDAGSVECVAELWDDSIHLAPDDACAVDLGVPVDGIATDIDGEPRGADGWDAGADERTP